MRSTHQVVSSYGQIKSQARSSAQLLSLQRVRARAAPRGKKGPRKSSSKGGRRGGALSLWLGGRSATWAHRFPGGPAPASRGWGWGGGRHPPPERPLYELAAISNPESTPTPRPCTKITLFRPKTRGLNMRLSLHSARGVILDLRSRFLEPKHQFRSSNTRAQSSLRGFWCPNLDPACLSPNASSSVLP